MWSHATLNPAGSQFHDTGVAPNIEYKGKFQINLATGDIKCEGSVRKFPAYEAYIIVAGKPPVVVFRQEAIGTVLNLAFSRDVHASAKF